MCSLSNAVALTVSNITSTLAGIPWRDIGLRILRLPVSKCDEISSQCSTDEERTTALVREWLLRDPLASWRKIIRELHTFMYYASSEEHFLGDVIVHYAEELTGKCVRFRSIQWHGFTPARPSSLSFPLCIKKFLSTSSVWEKGLPS